MSITDLNQLAVDRVVEAASKAYAPYSKFNVGAVLVAADGSFVEGCNVENASYGLAICAERTAMVKAVFEGKTDFTTCYVYAYNDIFVIV